MIGEIDGKNVEISSLKYAQKEELLNGVSNLEFLNAVHHLEQEGHVILVVSVNGKIAGVISLRDELKPEAKNALNMLSTFGIESVMLSGDHEKSVKAIGQNLNISLHYELLPEDKLRLVNGFCQQGITAAVGDGMNDAPALTAADVGIAMGSGTSIAMESAQIVISHNNLLGIPYMVFIAKKVLKNIKFNITIALGLKFLFLIFVLSGDIKLWMAVLADSGATVLVTLNAMRILRVKKLWDL
jgi:Cd2+/Zn2+-exporting ATPase